MDIGSTPTSRLDSGGSASEWQAILCREFYNTQITSSDADGRFNAQMSRVKHGPLETIFVQNPAQRQLRTKTDIARDGVDSVLLIHVISGRANFWQLNKECRIATNDSCIMDCGSPFSTTVLENTQNLSIRIPRDMFAESLDPEDFAGLRIDGSSDWGVALAAYLRAVRADLDMPSPLPARSMAEHALHLVGAALGRQATANTSHQKALVRRILSTIRECHQNEDITPQEVSSALGMSKTYMHRLLAQHGTTFCQELNRIRIESAAEMLSYVSNQGVTINEIAIRCGLPNQHFFSRKFRAIKGITPSQYRQMAISGDKNLLS